jgi:uncharacterized membrane protein
MRELIFAAFHDRERANEAIDRLEEAGFVTEDISIILRHNGKVINEGETVVSAEGEPNTTSRVGRTAVTGGVIGGLAGFLAGVLGIIVVGPIAAVLGLGGLIGTTITGLVIGAAAGGLAGALTRVGVPEKTARSYEEVVGRGGVILAVPTKIHKDEVRRILENSGAEDITE